MREHRVGSDDLDAHAKQHEAALSNTSKEALIERFGADRYKEYPNGRWEVRLDGWGEVDAFDEMDRPRARVEREARLNSKPLPQATLVDSDGRTFDVDADRAEFAAFNAARNGVQLRERMRYKPTARYVATPDGLVRVV